MAVKEGGKKSVSILSNKFNEPGDGKAFLFAGREHAFGGSSLSKLFGGGKAPFTRQLDIVLARVQITFGWALVLKRSDGKARGRDIVAGRVALFAVYFAWSGVF